MADESKVVALQKFIVVSDRELELLHDAIQVLSPGEDVDEGEIEDLEVRLSTAIEVPPTESEWKEAVVALLPEHLRDMARRVIVYNQGDEHVIGQLWAEQDVFDKAKDMHIKGVTREQAQEILSEMDRHADAEYGITWSTIESYLQDLVDDKTSGVTRSDDEEEGDAEGDE